MIIPHLLFCGDCEEAITLYEKNTGYVVIGDHQRIKGYSLFLCKEHAAELHFLDPDFRDEFLPTPEEQIAAQWSVRAVGGDM